MRVTNGPGLRSLTLAAVLSGGLLACGEVTPIPGIAPDDAPRRLAEAICPKAYQCCMTEQLMDNDQAGTDVASCKTKSRDAFTQQVAGIKASQAKGRVVYDGLKVEACVARIESAPCSELNTTNHFTGIPECASFLQPKVAPGGACTADFECVGGACDTSAVPSGTAGDGVCKAFAKLGEACASTTPCSPELICDGATAKCTTHPPGGASPEACFYSSACNFAGGDRGAASLLTVALLLGALVARRRR